MNFNFMKNYKSFVLISSITFILSLTLFFTKGINYGIDFTGGTLIQLKFEKEVDIEKIRPLLLENEKFKNSITQYYGNNNDITIKTKNNYQNSTKILNEELVNVFLKTENKFIIQKIDIVGPKIGDELKYNSLIASFFTILVILLYVYYRFQKEFAISSVVALLHDLIITIGFLIIFQIEFNTEIVAALLTLLGYSLNDTIIIFDRIREKIQILKNNNNITLLELINTSINSVFTRTILTSLTTLFVIVNLIVLGGESLFGFAFTLLIGIVIGTYSSIFIASPLLIYMKFDFLNFKKILNEKEKKKKEKEEQDKKREKYEKSFK